MRGNIAAFAPPERAHKCAASVNPHKQIVIRQLDSIFIDDSTDMVVVSPSYLPALIAELQGIQKTLKKQNRVKP